jgi:tetraacyldisaccharide 4'-kinase
MQRGRVAAWRSASQNATNMSDRHQRALDLLSGRRRGVGATVARAGLACVEPIYAGVMTLRNRLYDRQLLLRSHALPRPVVSVGNLTTGGTGKTPVVAWLANELRNAGVQPAILMRGYKATAAHGSDEAAELRDRLGPGVPVVANLDRVAGAAEALKQDATVGVFVLDDGFQHRRVRRDVDLVLIDATNPFGFGHVLPRGLLRERVSGIRRAAAVVITRADLVPESELIGVEGSIRRHHPHVPIVRSWTAFTRLSDGRPVESLREQPVAAFCGIGNPDAFRVTLDRLGARVVAFRAFPDHHPFTPAELAEVTRNAEAAGATVLVTTAKDRTRLPRMDSALPVVALEIEAAFSPAERSALLDLVLARVRLVGTER